MTDLQRHYGWEMTETKYYKSLFSQENLLNIQSLVRFILNKDINKDIKVTLDVIHSVLYECFTTHRPEIGDPFTNLRIGSREERNDFRDLNDRTVSIIVSHIKNEYLTIQQNSKLSKWTTVLGSHNSAGLQSYSNSSIKLKRRRLPLQFHMRL